jgi:hypothetical protein
MRKAVVAFLIVVAAFVIGANYNEYRAYECSGVMSKTPTTLFIKIAQPRWWVFWGRGIDGVLSVEIPSSTRPFREDIFMIKRNLQNYLDLYRYPSGGEIVDLRKPAQGQFSLISNSLVLNISDQESFRGLCTPKNN